MFRPLTLVEQATPPHIRQQREALYERFKNVIIGAGYTGEAPQRILDEHFEAYMQDVPGFEKMLKSYEENDYDPE